LGYYTDYIITWFMAKNMSIENTSPLAYTLKQRLDKLSDYEWNIEFFMNRNNTPPTKLFLAEMWFYDTYWEDEEENMITLSKEYPEIYFEVKGYGQDREDHWITRYHNGKHETISAEISFPPFQHIPDPTHIEGDISEY